MQRLRCMRNKLGVGERMSVVHVVITRLSDTYVKLARFQVKVNGASGQR